MSVFDFSPKQFIDENQRILHQHVLLAFYLSTSASQRLGLLFSFPLLAPHLCQQCGFRLTVHIDCSANISALIPCLPFTQQLCIQGGDSSACSTSYNMSPALIIHHAGAHLKATCVTKITDLRSSPCIVVSPKWFDFIFQSHSFWPSVVKCTSSALV